MSANASARLYSPQILSLAVRLADYPLDDRQPLLGEANSRTCGSKVACSLTLNSGRIAEVGLRVSACAVGQAAAAIFASHARGFTESDLAKAEGQLGAWLGLGGSVPDWPEIELLEPALPFPARHSAILLPWNAALRALCKA